MKKNKKREIRTEEGLQSVDYIFRSGATCVCIVLAKRSTDNSYVAFIGASMFPTEEQDISFTITHGAKLSKKEAQGFFIITDNENYRV